MFSSKLWNFFSSSRSMSPIYRGVFVELKTFFGSFESVAKSPRNPFPSDLTGIEEEVWGLSWIVRWVLGVNVILVVNSCSKSGRKSSFFGVLSICPVNNGISHDQTILQYVSLIMGPCYMQITRHANKPDLSSCYRVKCIMIGKDFDEFFVRLESIARFIYKNLFYMYI